MRTLTSIILTASLAASPVAGKEKPDMCNDHKYDYSTYCLNTDLEEVYQSVYKIFSKKGGKTMHTGTGFLLRGGYVLTVNHLADKDMQTFLKHGNIEIPLEEIARDPGRDFLLLRLKDRDAPTYSSFLNEYTGGISNSKDLKLGNVVYLFGNAMDRGINVRSGIISQRNKSGLMNLTTSAESISNGAAVGDSGGPVFALRDGDLVLVGMSSMVTRVSSVSYIIGIDKIKGLLAEYMR